MNIKVKAALIYLFWLAFFAGIVGCFVGNIKEHFLTLLQNLIVISVSIYGYNDTLNHLQKKKEKET